MNYPQVLEYMYSRLPMYQRIGAAAYKADLSNTISLAEYLGNPEKKFRSIHIAGTNGKGSVAHFLASIFQEAGYKTGLTTSPHLKDFRERCRINGQMISEDYITRFINDHKAYFEKLNPSFFEMSIAMFFNYFADEQVDIAIVETGLGGRLDSTNVVAPEISVITNIGLDHMNLLGNTLELIAAEKAGIIKPNTPVVLGKMRKDAEQVITDYARSASAPILKATSQYRITNIQKTWEDNQPLLNLQLTSSTRQLSLVSPLAGNYQTENIITVLGTIDSVNKQGLFRVTDNHIKSGIRNVITNTAIAGRWQILATKPLTVCDTGHNKDGITAVLQNIESLPHRHLHFVLGVMNDKDITGILKLMPRQNTSYYYCQPDVPRAMDVIILAENAEKTGLKGIIGGTVEQALNLANKNAEPEDLIFIGGSSFVVAEVL